MDITPEMARAELQRRRSVQGRGQITPEMARAELARRKSQQGGRVADIFAQVERQPDYSAEVFARQIEGMDETDISIARSKNTPLGAYLREQAKSPQEGETAQQTEQRLYGSLPEAENGLVDHARAFTTNVVDGVPVIGPALTKGVNAAAAGGASMMNGRGFDENMAAAEALNESDQQEMPISSIAGRITGNIAPMLPLGATKLGAQALGITGKNLGTRAAASGASSLAIAGADTAARGGSLDEIIEDGVWAGGIGAAIPFVGAGVRAGWKAAADRISPTLRGLKSPTEEGGRRLGEAYDMNGAPVRMSAAEEASAARYGQPVINADRGGETARASALSVANQSPQARRELKQFAQDRFENQGPRLQNFLSRLMRGATDDLAYQDGIKAAAQKANRPAYKAAFDAPEAQSMWTPRLQELMQAPAMQSAAKSATGRGANRAAVEGFKPIRNPFTFNQDGTFALALAKNGAQAVPSLQFWDQTKRNLDGMIGTAQRQGDKTLSADLMALKTALVSEMDSAVPAYASARRGAAGFFDAEDALEAGKKFVNINRAIPETKRVLAKMSKDEREAFAVGFAAELKDKIFQARDRFNVVNQIFGSPEAREKIAMALGPERYKDFEAFINVETTMDLLRQTFGNSTTAQQLKELTMLGGVGAAGGYMYSGGDMTATAAAAAAGAGGRYAVQKANQKVFKVMANMLLSDDPAQIESAVKLVRKNKDAQEALKLLGSLARGAGVSAAPALAGAE